MSKDFAFLFKPGDYLRDTQCLSERVQVSYDRIMCEHMRNICITQSQLNFFTKRLTPDEKSELLQVMNEIEGGFEIEWVAESIRERIAYSNSRRQNRKGKTKEHMNNICESYVKHMEGEGEGEIEYEDVIVYFNGTRFPKIQKLAGIRKTHLQARVKEYGIEKVKEVISKADKSDFLRGINNNGWKASFDWIINPNNFIKIMEGNYDNKPRMLA